MNLKVVFFLIMAVLIGKSAFAQSSGGGTESQVTNLKCRFSKDLNPDAAGPYLVETRSKWLSATRREMEAQYKQAKLYEGYRDLTALERLNHGVRCAQRIHTKDQSHFGYNEYFILMFLQRWYDEVSQKNDLEPGVRPLKERESFVVKSIGDLLFFDLYENFLKQDNKKGDLVATDIKDVRDDPVAFISTISRILSKHLFIEIKKTPDQQSAGQQAVILNFGSTNHVYLATKKVALSIFEFYLSPQPQVSSALDAYPDSKSDLRNKIIDFKDQSVPQDKSLQADYDFFRELSGPTPSPTEGGEK